MFSKDFLLQIAATYGLTPEQKEVFLRRLLENKTHDEIADELNISQSACLRRMADVYKKFQIQGRGRGKDGELRNFLISKQEKLEQSSTSDAGLTDQISILRERVSVIEENTSQDSGVIPLATNQITESLFPSGHNCLIDLSCQNLPPQSNAFIGRSEDLSRLLKYLSEEHCNPVITVDGIGGVGKTALVLEAAKRCLEARNNQNYSEVPKFDAIIFVSAKETYLSPTGIIRRLESQQNLTDIYKAIAFTLNVPSILKTSGEEQYQIVKQSLRRQKTLLIVDNFETIHEEEKNKILGFLFDLPSTVKSVITTREQRVIHVQVRLDGLSEEDSLELIRQQIQEKALSLSDEQAKKLYHKAGGVPLVIIYAIGRLANSIPIEQILQDLKSENLKSESKDLAHFLFQKFVDELKGELAYQLLMAMAIFHKAPIFDALVSVAGLKTKPSSQVNNNLSHLQRLSLVRQQNGRYRMLPLTREYALAELNANQDFKKEAYQRCFDWYLNFAKKHGGDDWGEWHTEYDCIDEEWRNFMVVLNWCAEQGQYSQVDELWKYLNKCANLYGYWDERLKWLDWLLDKSRRCADWSTFVRVASAYSWTLILQESPENLVKANELQQKAWKRRERTEPQVQYALAENIAVLRIRQKRYQEAHEWFDTYKKLVAEAGINDKEQQRTDIRFFYYSAEILYREHKYEQAKSLYQKVVELAEKIGWIRFVVNAQSWLATIAVKQNNLDEAERLLDECLPVAERNKDKRRTACCQYSRARLEQLRGNLEKAREWANKAHKNFEGLGMGQDAEQVRSFLDSLTA